MYYHFKRFLLNPGQPDLLLLKKWNVSNLRTLCACRVTRTSGQLCSWFELSFPFPSTLIFLVCGSHWEFAQSYEKMVLGLGFGHNVVIIEDWHLLYRRNIHLSAVVARTYKGTAGITEKTTIQNWRAWHMVEAWVNLRGHSPSSLWASPAPLALT